MGFSDLTQEEMIELTSRLITSEGTTVNGQLVPTMRRFLESQPLLSAMLPLLEAAHAGVLVSTKRTVVAPPRLKEVRERQTQLDATHDPYVRGMLGVLPGLAELVSDPSLKERLLALVQVIIPEGASRTNLSYRRESGAAKRTEARLTLEDKKLLGNISVQIKGHPTIVLLQIVEELISVGKELGVLEDEKEAILRNLSAAPSGPTERESINLWVNHITTFVRLVEALKFSAEDEEKLLGPLLEAEQRAVARKKAALAPAAAPTPPPAPTTPSDSGA